MKINNECITMKHHTYQKSLLVVNYGISNTIVFTTETTLQIFQSSYLSWRESHNHNTLSHHY